MSEPNQSTTPLYDVTAAREAIADIAVQTPVLSSPALTELVDTPVTLKLENLQVTGSFKIRGAANKILSLTDEERARGVVTCSSGNHGKAVSYVAGSLGIPATVVVPEWVDASKLDAIRRHGAEAVLHGSTYDEAEEHSFDLEREEGFVFVHPFDDPHVVAGQGTIGQELMDQLPSMDCVVVPLSGGGLLGGIAYALKTADPEIRVIGASAENARVMYESLKLGKPTAFPEDDTLASALSGGIGLDNEHSFALVRDYVDEHVIVTEAEIKEAMAFAAEEHKLVVEGGGAVGIAAVLANKIRREAMSVAVVVSGGNIDMRSFAEVVASEL
jgi:threonine dehydratase